MTVLFIGNIVKDRRMCHLLRRLCMYITKEHLEFLCLFQHDLGMSARKYVYSSKVLLER